LVRVNVESRARGGEESEKGAGCSVSYGSDVSGKKEFGVKYDTEVSDMGVPRDEGVLEAEWCWDDRAASGEYYRLCLVCHFLSGSLLG